jgi:SAM-dependent methyltransferase
VSQVDFDRYAESYNDLLREQTRFFSADEAYFARYKVALARRLVTRDPARILEYGCGIGRNIAFLRDAFPRAQIVGSDVSAKSLELARAANPGTEFRLEDDQWHDAGFDLAFVAGVFHHIPPPARTAAAKLLASRLRSGGTLVVFEHNPYNPVTRRIVSNCPYDEDAVLLRPRELRGLIAGADLAGIRQGYTLFFPPRLTWLARIEPLLSWLPLGGQYWVSATA